MMRRAVEFEARFWEPSRRAWCRERATAHIYLPDRAPEGTTNILPGPLFTYSASVPMRIEHYAHGPNLTTFGLQSIAGWTVFRGAVWRESPLWSQVTFHAPWQSEVPGMPDSPWWVRWRMPDARPDMLGRAVDTLDAIYDRPDDPAMITAAIEQFRREILLDRLGAPVFRDQAQP